MCRITANDKMEENCFTLFKSEIDSSLIPNKLNNPFDLDTPDICKLAVQEVEVFIIANQDEWKHDFGVDNDASLNLLSKSAKGKMFGVLIVRNTDGQLGYLFTFSGKIADEQHHPSFVPSLFDISTDDYFMNRGMRNLSAMTEIIEHTNDLQERQALKEERKLMSVRLQQRLFDCYNFLNVHKEQMSLCSIFEKINKRPPAGAGECAAPKLLQYAFAHNMEALAVAEFWWGKASKSGDRQHRCFYPACNDKCLPILGFMIRDILNI